MRGLLDLGWWSAVYLWMFWCLYVLIMGFYRAHLANRLSKVALVLALPAVLLGFCVDLVANWTLATLLFWQWPLRPLELVTDRLSRYISTPSGWRTAPALWVCQSLLDYFDPNDRHCGTATQSIPTTSLPPIFFENMQAEIKKPLSP